MRKDLITISETDLELYTNRGTVKRAARDLDEALFSCSLNEDESGMVEAVWSDGVTCRFAPELLIRDGRCTCPATTMCRHMVRTVLFYQRFHKEAVQENTSDAPPVWDPGDISDTDMEAHVQPTQHAKARQLFSEGLLVECIRSSKPYAVIHGLGVTVRFLVPGDFRYAHADCEGNIAIQASVIAVWAFRLLDKNSGSGFVVTAPSARISLDTFEQGISSIAEIVNYGFANLPQHFANRLASAGKQLREAGLTWPADIMTDFALEFKRYMDHDSLFSPERCVEYAGEFLLRADCLTAEQSSIPSALAGGTRYDVSQEFGTRRFTGLGSGVRFLAKSAILQVFFEDSDSGGIVVLEKEFPDPENGPAREFRFLGETPAAASAKLIDIARSQLLSGSLKRTASGLLAFGRKLIVNPQAFQWERLRENVLSSDYSELRSRLALQPPSSLRARRMSDSFHVIAIAGAENIRFDPVTQEIRCQFIDSQRERISMVLPYLSRSAPGCELLLKSLSQTASRPVFAAGKVKITSEGLTIFPVSVIIEQDGRRTMVQPYLDGPQGALKDCSSAVHMELPLQDPIIRWLSSLENALSEMLQTGVKKADSETAALWKRLAGDGRAIGFVRLAQQVSCIAEALEKKMHHIGANENNVCDMILEMLRVLRFTRDLF